MPNLQEVFNRIQEAKQEQKGIKAMYKEALDKSGQYKQVTEQLKTLKIEKQKIETAIKQEYRRELEKLEEVKTGVESDTLILSDLAINELVGGKKVEVTDKYQNKYEPVFSVRFKKAG